MLLSNFAKRYSIRNCINMNGTTDGTYSNVSYEGSTVPSYFGITSFYQTGFTIDVGFGDTPPQLTDYILDDGNYDNRKLTFISQNLSRVDNEIVSLNARFKNNGETPVTVKEIGIYFANSSTNQSAKNVYSLIARSILDTPVTIAPGESYSFTYSIEI